MNSSEKLGYFLAGALIPALAYIFLGLSKSKSTSNSRTDTVLYDYDGDDDLQEQLGKPSKDPREWGMRDCPYKVRSFGSFAEQLISRSLNSPSNPMLANGTIFDEGR